MDTGNSLQERAEAIVRRGREVRRNIAAAVAASAQRAHEAADGFLDLLRAPVVGAARAVDAALPADREGTLRQVVEGIGDGVAMAAHAAELTLREAGAGSVRYAREDLERLGNGLRDVSGRFVDSVVAAAVAAGGHAASEGKSLKDHAATTLRRIEPSLATAIAAARSDPVGMGRDALVAGVAAARGAAGGLFTAVGQKLQAMGAALGPRRDPTA